MRDVPFVNLFADKVVKDVNIKTIGNGATLKDKEGTQLEIRVAACR